MYSHLLANARTQDLCKVSLIFVIVIISWCLIHIRKISGALSWEDYDSNPLYKKYFEQVCQMSYIYNLILNTINTLIKKYEIQLDLHQLLPITGRCLWRVSLYKVYRRKKMSFLRVPNGLPLVHDHPYALVLHHRLLHPVMKRWQQKLQEWFLLFSCLVLWTSYFANRKSKTNIFTLCNNKYNNNNNNNDT